MIRKYTFICFIGIDGSGKTTQALSLNEYFKKQGINSIYVWSRRRPFLLKIPIKLIKRYVLKEKEKTEGEAYYSIINNRRGLFGNKIFRFFMINFSLLEYLIFLYFKIILPNKNKEVLICDRYLYDAIVDFVLSCSMPVSKIDVILNNLISRWFPKPDCIYFINISAEVGVSRKKDGTSLAYLEDRVPMYRHIAKITGAQVIDGTLPLDEIKQIICNDAREILKRNKNLNHNLFLSQFELTKANHE